MEHRYHADLVAAGMPSFDVTNRSDAPFLFAEDLAGEGAAAAQTAQPFAPVAPFSKTAGAGGNPLLGLMGGGAVAGGAAPLISPAATIADSNPLIQAMVGQVDKVQKGTEALDEEFR